MGAGLIRAGRIGAGRNGAEWSGVDILVNNAVIQKTARLAEADAGTWDAMIAVNLSAAFPTMRLALPGLAA